jgi:hypothetical protein
MHSSIVQKFASGAKLRSLSLEEKNYMRVAKYTQKTIPKEYAPHTKRKTLLSALSDQIKSSLETEAEKSSFDWQDVTVQAARGRAMIRLMEMTDLPLEEIVKKGVYYSDYYNIGEEKLSFILGKIKEDSLIDGQGRFIE